MVMRLLALPPHLWVARGPPSPDLPDHTVGQGGQERQTPNTSRGCVGFIGVPFRII